jgi:hypothetical protein
MVFSCRDTSMFKKFDFREHYPGKFPMTLSARGIISISKRFPSPE